MDRSIENRKKQYLIEKEYAELLKKSKKEDRISLYNKAYDNLYCNIDDHPQLIKQQEGLQSEKKAKSALELLKPFLSPKKVFLEIGSGEGSVSIAVADYVKKVIALDVSAISTDRDDYPKNLDFRVYSGCNLPNDISNVDIVYSDQVIEHMHPDDAVEMLNDIYSALATGGVFICGTPNKTSGPHDISKHFTKVATGFHLKEYSYNELYKLLKDAGFKKISVFLYLKGNCFKVSALPFIIFESILLSLPYAIRKPLSQIAIIKWVLGIRFLAIK